MTFRKLSPRWALWVFAAALLMKAAMPLLANASAQLQGKALVEVCTVYGVAMVPLDGGNHAPAPEHSPDHADHCALTALAALASVEPAPVTPVPVTAVDTATAASHPSSLAPDASAAWVARRKHGPPAFA